MNNYYTLKVKEVIQETKDAIVIQFKQPLFKKINYKSGQFLTLIIPINGKKERRSYSICSTPDLDDHIAVMVKRVAGGLVSNYLNDHVKAGDSLEVLEPMGNFVLEPDRTKKRHLVFF
ncbi:MAG: FAD-binding oxidoreductase, partial [Flammeovirgaceae bacterium]|nr:FAD-binding oxidoreductase [Flammeovirgaceae bacterium]MDW8288336.1 FAD-binding oxidoreductase [Flammeovirgaceae bacterium]